jgi:Zn-dependent M28 family amino/carboxypeptidase
VESGNVILDLIGREKPGEIVLIGGHLDSWDLGTGAIDDGAGIAITTAAAALIAQLPERPRRTIRVVMFGAEEVGLLGARAYAARHADEVGQHVLATESDFGAGPDLAAGFQCEPRGQSGGRRHRAPAGATGYRPRRQQCPRRRARHHTAGAARAFPRCA